MFTKESFTTIFCKTIGSHGRVLAWKRKELHKGNLLSKVIVFKKEILPLLSFCLQRGALRPVSIRRLVLTVRLLAWKPKELHRGNLLSKVIVFKKIILPLLSFCLQSGALRPVSIRRLVQTVVC